MLSTSLFMWLSSIVHLQLSTSPSLSTRRSVCLSVSTYIYQNILIHIITVHIINPSPNISINWYNHYIYNALLTCTSWSLSPWRSNTANCHTEALPWRCGKQNDSKLSFYLRSSCKLLAVQISRSWKFWRLETLKRDLRKPPKSFEGFLSKVTNLPLSFSRFNPRKFHVLLSLPNQVGTSQDRKMDDGWLLHDDFRRATMVHKLNQFSQHLPDSMGEVHPLDNPTKNNGKWLQVSNGFKNMTVMDDFMILFVAICYYLIHF